MELGANLTFSHLCSRHHILPTQHLPYLGPNFPGLPICCRMACASSSSCASSQPRYLNTLTHSNTEPLTVNSRHRARAKEIADSHCSHWSILTLHSFILMCCGNAGFTCIQHCSQGGSSPLSGRLPYPEHMFKNNFKSKFKNMMQCNVVHLSPQS